MSDVVKEVSSADFEAEVLKSDLPVVVDFWAPWCDPCMEALPQFEAFAEKYSGKAKFVKVNFDDEKGLVQQYDITGIPTFLFLKGSEVKERSEGFGFPSNKICKIWELYLGKLL